MSDQHPIYTPPPDYSPSPAPDSYGPEAFGSAAPGQPTAQTGVAEPPRKKKTILIVGIIVAVLALCCCFGAGILAFFVVDSDTLTQSGDTETGLLPDLSESDAAGDSRVEEWLAWDPTIDADILQSPPAEKEGLILEAMSIVAPEFNYDEAVWWQGGYDSDQDWYYSDSFYVRATHPSSDSVSAVVDFLIEGDEMAAVDIDYTPDEGAVTAQIEGGARVLEYRPLWGASGFTLDGEDDIALWETLGEDWPDAVVLDKHESDLGSGYATIDLTSWAVFIHDTMTPYVRTTYENVGGEWSLVQWEYIYSEDATEGPST